MPRCSLCPNANPSLFCPVALSCRDQLRHTALPAPTGPGTDASANPLCWQEGCGGPRGQWLQPHMRSWVMAVAREGGRDSPPFGEGQAHVNRAQAVFRGPQRGSDAQQVLFRPVWAGLWLAPRRLAGEGGLRPQSLVLGGVQVMLKWGTGGQSHHTQPPSGALGPWSPPSEAPAKSLSCSF